MLFGHCGDPLRFCDTADQFPVAEDFVVADIVVSQKAGDGQKTEQNGEDDPDIDEVHFSLTPCRENLAPIAGNWGESLEILSSAPSPKDLAHCVTCKTRSHGKDRGKEFAIKRQCHATGKTCQHANSD